MNRLALLLRKYALQVSQLLTELLTKNNYVAVLNYHSISDAADRYAVSQTSFKKQIVKISRYAEFISLDKALNSENKRVKPAICLTFDDGFEDVLKVLPVINKYKIPVTIFILADSKNANRNELNTNQKLLSVDQIKLLIKNGWTIGSHSLTHSDFSKLTKSQLKLEIINSKKVIEKKYDIKVKYFAYPKGKYSPEIKSIAKKAGYTAAFSVNAGCIDSSSDKFILPRSVIDKTHSLEEFPGVFTPTAFFLRKVTDKFRVWERFLS